VIDFPANPTPGQTFTGPDGTVWIWDGSKWTGTGSPWIDTHYRNRIINGDMSVDQRHGGAGVAMPAGAGYVFDRWGYAGQGVGNVAQVALSVAGRPPGAGFTYALQWNTTTAHTVAAGDVSQVYQVIEGYNFNDANFGTASAQPLVLEFWANCSLTGTFAGVFMNRAGNRSYVFTYSLPTANTWVKIRINIPGDTAGTWAVADNAAIAQVNFNLGAGSTNQTAPGVWTAGYFLSTSGAVNPVATNGATFYITGVALMVGAAAQNASPEFRKYADNLTDCMRYYEKSYAQGTVSGAITTTGESIAYLAMQVTPTSTAWIGQAVTFKTVKRIGPTMTLYSPATGVGGKVRDAQNNADCLNDSIMVSGDSGFTWNGNQTAVSSTLYMTCHWTADADF
jgi:hypothetical protein